MSFDPYFKRDIARVLNGCAYATEGAAREGDVSEEYKRGVRNTLVSVGLAFGLEPVGQVVQQGQQSIAGLLWAETPQER